MKPEDVLVLAQQGNPKVIAAIINRTTEPCGIFVRIARRGSRLYILVEGKVAEQQDALVSFMQASLQKLQLRPIDSAIVYGRLKGEVSMAWSEQIKIPPAANLSNPRSNADLPFTPKASLMPSGKANYLKASHSTPISEANHSQVSPSANQSSQISTPPEAQASLKDTERIAMPSDDAASVNLSSRETLAETAITIRMEREAIATVKTLALDHVQSKTTPLVSETNAYPPLLKPISITPHMDVSTTSSTLVNKSISENSNHHKDVIRSDGEYIGSLSPDLPSSVRNAFKQEDRQVRNNQQTIRVLEKSYKDSPSETTISAEDSPFHMTKNDEPNSITAKFNTFVQTSDNLPDITNALQNETAVQNEPNKKLSSQVLPDLKIGSGFKVTDAVSRSDHSIDGSSIDRTSEASIDLTEVVSTEANTVGYSSAPSFNMPTERLEEGMVNAVAFKPEQQTPLPKNVNQDDAMAEKNKKISETGPDLDNVDLDAFIRCPEALVFVFFTIAFFMWQTYVSIVKEAAPEGQLTGSKLAQRLGVNPSTISRRKEKPGFEEWSQSIDPDGLAWSYGDGFFVPYLSE
ncbi:MAG: hypothetical protein AAGD25_21415 [Cyanobacteria bacterium P01_F01_bin.150]